ncbi:hypothetical protein F7725_016262 [Dissostichus mawsoni]|uniref:Uncharacterized protein n=1 Tax=Dissostichus mawsoni TaxID=36200 RepID=A0A7J5Z3A5_DISMA|nr:hypothetical protein F7725_016262 [Dissostichus mawsoni]
MEDYEVSECLKQLMIVKEAGLEELIPTTWWPTHFDKEGKDEREPSDESADERLRRRAYERGCQRLKKRIEGGGAAGSDPEAAAQQQRQNHEAYVPPQLFYNGKVDYFDLQRLGGLLSHLKKTLKGVVCCMILRVKQTSSSTRAEIQASSMDDLDEDEESGAAQRPFGGGGGGTGPAQLAQLSNARKGQSLPEHCGRQPDDPQTTSEPAREGQVEGSHGNDGLLLGRPMEEPEQPIADKSLLEIVDGIVMMYNLSVHQQLGKMVVVSDDVHEYARADILDELQKSQKVFSEKLNHLSRRLAWINATIYSKEKMLDVYWLLCVCIRTIEHADNTGSLFAFAPEFYLNVAMNATAL